MEIIDAHTHIFPPEIIERRSAIAETDEGFGKIYGNPRAVMVDHTGLLKYMEREKVAGCVVCSFPFADKGLITLMNDYVLDTAKSHPAVTPLAAVNLAGADTGVREAERCLGQGARGIGEMAFYERCLGRDELKGLDGVARALEASGSVLLIHMNEQVGHHYNGKMSVDFAEVVKFVEDHPGLNIVLAHLGGGLCFYEFMPEIRKAFSRVFYDTAAAPYIYSQDVYGYIGKFLAEKTLFGSDYPLLSFKRYDEGIRRLDRETGEKILGGNARRVFGRG